MKALVLLVPLIYFLVRLNQQEKAKNVPWWEKALSTVTNYFEEISGINDKWDDLFQKYANTYGISAKMLKAVAANESYLGKYTGYEPKGGTSGLMHIKLGTARDFFPNLSSSDLENDEIQIKSAAAYLQNLKTIFNGDERKIVMSYNQGQGNTLKGREFAAPYWDRYLRNKNRLG